MDSDVTVTLADNDAVFSNPGIGWVLHYFDNIMAHYGSRLDPADTVDEFPGLSNLYLRLRWSAIEPRRGQFDWSVVGTPAQRWLDRGLHLSLRFSCCESKADCATPRWVRELGAKGCMFTPGKGIDPSSTQWEPDYNDAVFLEHLDRFLELGTSLRWPSQGGLH